MGAEWKTIPPTNKTLQVDFCTVTAYWQNGRMGEENPSTTSWFTYSPISSSVLYWVARDSTDGNRSKKASSNHKERR